jgi:hypothetical protein
VNGAVHALAAQQASPRPPQLPLPQDPSTQVPDAAPQLVPLPWQMPETQQPPAAQLFSAQQGSPSAPQLEHLPELAQTDPGAEQRFGLGLGAVQHVWEEPPQLPQEPVAAHVPQVEPQLLPGATHVLLESQHPPEHVLFGQHGKPAVPHAEHVPSEQTWLPPQLVPLGAHTALTQHPPARHVPPLQHPWPGPPQDGQAAPSQLEASVALSLGASGGLASMLPSLEASRPYASVTSVETTSNVPLASTSAALASVLPSLETSMASVASLEAMSSCAVASSGALSNASASPTPSVCTSAAAPWSPVSEAPSTAVASLGLPLTSEETSLPPVSGATVPPRSSDPSEVRSIVATSRAALPSDLASMAVDVEASSTLPVSVSLDEQPTSILGRRDTPPSTRRARTALDG